MLMPSQSPSPTNTIQTLPSDQQQQKKQLDDEYVDTSSNQKNSTIRQLRREKSMEFDEEPRFLAHINDDINNNYSRFESTDEMIKSDSADSSPASSSGDDEPPLTIQMHSSTPLISSESAKEESSPRLSFLTSVEPNPAMSSTRRAIRPAATRRSDEQISSLNPNEPDPNVFLISPDTNSHNTIRKTKHDVKRFVMYIDEHFGEQKNLNTLSAESLCKYLKHYFENTKKFDGTQYEPDTLRSFLLSIERFLKSKSYEYNLMESPLFQPCRQVIMHKREQWRKMGGGNHANQQHAAKSGLTLLNLKNVTLFDRTKPDGLLLEIYVHISKLCQDKTPSTTQLVWGDIVLIDEQYLVCHQQKSDTQTIRLCATPSQLSTCPIQAYRLYATHRPPQCNMPQSPFFLMPRASTSHHTWYKTTGAGKNLEQVLQSAIQRHTLPKQSSPSSSSLGHLRTFDHLSSLSLPDSSLSALNSKRNESRTSSPNQMPLAKRIHLAGPSIQPLNLSVNTGTSSALAEDDSGTASSSPTNSLSNDVASTSLLNRNSLSLVDVLHKQSSLVHPIWDESVTEILLTVAKQRDTRVVKINILRTYLEEKLGVVEFLCLYRGFKSEPKLTFHGTPWEHYQRFLPVLFTLLALDNTSV